MDEVFAPAGGIDKARLKALSRRSDARGLAHLTGHLVLLAATATPVFLARGTLWLPAALWLHGAVLVFLFAPLHETIHRTAFRARWLNDAVAWVCGIVLILPPGYFRAFHFAHHRFTQDPARDPELARPKPRTLAGYLWIVSGLPYWGERVATTLRHATGTVDQGFIAPRQRAAIIRETRWLLAIYAAIAAASWLSGSWAALLYWVAPALLGQPLLRLYLLAEHTGCPLVPDMLRNSRTTLTNPAVRWLAWNMPYHVEHHAYPAVPFHALPRAHAILRERIAVLTPGYLAAQRGILRALNPDRTSRALSGQP